MLSKFCIIFQAFGKTCGNTKCTTIRNKDPAFQDVIGTSRQLSFCDIKVINLLYNCNGKFLVSSLLQRVGKQQSKFIGLWMWCPENCDKKLAYAFNWKHYWFHVLCSMYCFYLWNIIHILLFSNVSNYNWDQNNFIIFHNSLKLTSLLFFLQFYILIQGIFV